MKRFLFLAIIFLISGSCSNSVLDANIVLKPSQTASSIETSSISEDSDLNSIVGEVLDQKGNPIKDAVVRLQTTKISTTTDENGQFQFDNIDIKNPVSITAWAEGYYISNAMVSTDDQEIKIEIHRFHEIDSNEYAWLTSYNLSGEDENQGCAECHSAKETGFSFSLPFDEWFEDAHSQSALNPRFLTTYNGTDVFGNQSPETKFIPANPTRKNSGDYSYIALAPDPTLPYYGPGYKLDFPGSGGNCANCHVPGAASVSTNNFSVDINEINGIEEEGIFCDFCHKIWDIQLSPQTNMPSPDQPGVMSYIFKRPPEGHQLFMGPYDDVAPGEDTYSALQTESQYCAGCHHGVFWDTVIYNSYGEWLESSYSNPESGQTCQDCHMPSTGANYFAIPEQGGLERDPDTIFSHRMPGASDIELLNNALTLTASAYEEENQIYVNVEIENDKTGHHVPAGYPGRHLILLVQVYDEYGNFLDQAEGPVLPEWCGKGDPNEGYYAGLPGMAYAKILQEDWTRYFPTVAYWNPNTLLSDNRIAALGTSQSEYIFSNTASGNITVDVQLFIRRSFKELMDWKSWDFPDILMESEKIIITK